MNDAQKRLMAEVRDIIDREPDRHEQGLWISTGYKHLVVLASKAARFAHLPVPEVPADPERPVCKTTACVAGWAALLAAPEGTFLVGDDLLIPKPGTSIVGENDPEPTETFLFHSDQYDYRMAGIFAAEALGLDDDQSDWLFNGVRTREQILFALAYLPEHPDASSEDIEIAFYVAR